MRAVQVSAHAWYAQGASAMGSRATDNFISNAGFIVTPGSVVVIDALGSPTLTRRLVEEIRRVSAQPVKRRSPCAAPSRAQPWSTNACSATPPGRWC